MEQAGAELGKAQPKLGLDFTLILSQIKEDLKNDDDIKNEENLKK